ncbi:MAG: apolipoprotein N-acyltransferase [Rhodospirillales bacterium]
MTSAPKKPYTGWRMDLRMLGAGALAAAALPPVHAIPVLLVCLPVLLSALATTTGRWGGFRCGWWFGFGMNLIGLYWITEAILIEADRFWWLVPLAVPALSAVMAVFVGIATAIARCACPGPARVFALAGAWTLSDLTRQFVLTGFPWNPLGSVWTIPGRLGDVMIQPAAGIGVHGLTLATLLLAAAPALTQRWRAAALAGFAVWAGCGLLRLNEVPTGTTPTPTVVVVQGNVPQGQKWNRALVDSIFSRYLTLTSDGVRQAVPGPVAVVWPETAVPFLLETDIAAREAIAAASGRAVALIGGVRFGVEGRPRNSLFALTPDAKVSQVFDKAHLVPFGEYQPNWIPLGVQLVPGGGFAPGPGPISLTLPSIPKVGPLICYEAIFPGQAVDRNNRPDWLVNVTNDAWFGNSTGPRQHLAAARMRAVEEGLPLVRAANTGISALFDAHGHEIARLGMGQAGVLVGPLPRALPPTLFGQVGLLLPGFFGTLALLAGILPGRVRPAATKLKMPIL